MTYVSKKEKVFDLPLDQDDSSSSLSTTRTEAKLKRFPSVSDRKAWSAEECQRYQHFYGLVNGSESNVSKSSSFKYIPFDVLLAILMAEKDAYIQELLERQDSRSSSGGKANVLYKAEGFEDSDDDREALIRKDAEVVALKNKIAGLESELEDYRETLTKAMHKLENMDAVMNENNLLKEKLKYSEETIKCLEEKKVKLEKELECFGKFCKMSSDKELIRKHFETVHRWEGGDNDEITRLSSERDILLEQLEILQQELERTKANAAEVDMLRKMSETTSSSLEEISKENETYKKKLESMKCLEKHIEELKKQAQILTEKYKRESQKANDHLKQIKLDAKELSLLREERDRLQQRVAELISYESQYISLKGKLHQVELIIDENEMLNKKLIQLDRLEMENEELKMKINELKSAEVQATEDKEKIVQLQGAVLDQEEEIRKMLKQIEVLSQGYADKNEIRRLQNEVDEKNNKLKKYEKQLADIPLLESEIDELKNKLQKCIDDFKTDKEILKRLQEELEACRKRCRELEEMSPSGCEESEKNTGKEVLFEEKGENTIETLTRDAECQSASPVYEDKSTEVVEDTMRNIQEIEEQNRVLKGEVETLRQKLSKIDLDELISQTGTLKDLLNFKEKMIQELNCEVHRLEDEIKMCEKFKADLENEVEHLKERNYCLKREIEVGQEVTKHMKESLTVEKKAREFAINMAKSLEEKLEAERTKREAETAILKLQKEETNMIRQEVYLYFCREIGELKGVNSLYKKLMKDLKMEKDMLTEEKEYWKTTENKTLKSLVKRLRAELEVLKSLSKPELEEECNALRNQVKSLLSETDALLEEIQTLKKELIQERKEKNSLENDLTNLQAELSACVTAGNEVLGREISAKEDTINELREELSEVKRQLENSVRKSQALIDSKDKLEKERIRLESEQKDLKNEVNSLVSRVEELNKVIQEKEEKEAQLVKDIQSCRETMQREREELTMSKDFTNVLKQRIKDLEDILKAKQEELETTKKASAEARDEVNRINFEMEMLKLRLADKGSQGQSPSKVQGFSNYEKDLEEKHALEEALRKIENELDELKVKLEECKRMEDEMAKLRNKKDALLRKMADFESEIERLNKKLVDFENVKNELVLLKTNKVTTVGDYEVNNLYEQLEEEKAQVKLLRSENVSIKEELKKAEALLEISKNLEKNIPQNPCPPTVEFYTPPTLPSPRSGDPIERSVEMISMNAHKKELENLENSYERKLTQLKERDGEKLRKVLENFEKEEKCRIKDFHDSINVIKCSYENDIRKLVEKHKASIMRLQGLHEDEVQELNTHYETQMEAIQTQNENVINDLKTESAEKCRQLREEHNREIRELENRYQQLLKEKENLFSAEKRSVEANLTQNTNDISEVHKQALDSLTQFYQNSIVELEEKHSREMKKCKKTNLKKIELMKNKYEALLVEERKKYEEQLEEMLLQLKKGEKGNAGTREKDYAVEKKHASDSETRLEFVEVLQKIINEGLESLTFDEVILVHSKTCFMPRNAEEEEEGGEENDDGGDGDGGEERGAAPVTPKFGSVCKHRKLVTAEKEELLKRIFTLEHEIVIKQLETHEAIVNMETAEEYRIQELKNALSTAQQKNAELKRLLSNQSKLQMDLKIDRYMLDRQANFHESSVLEKVKELEREKAEKKRLEEELQKERMNVKHLVATMEAEKERHRCQRKRDAEYVESIRQRLEEALNHEQMMETQLEREVELRSKLESELQGSRRTYTFMRDLPSSFIQPEPKMVKDLRNQDQGGSMKEARLGRSKSKHRKRSRTINNL